jgi:alanyl-tRNA synthetase
LFKIMSEGGVAAGIRRIEAVAGPAVLEYLNVREAVVRSLCDRFKVKPEEIDARIATLQEDLKASQKTVESLKQELAIAQSDSLMARAEAIGNFKVLVGEMRGVDANALVAAAERLQHKLGEGAVILASVPSEAKVSLVAAFSPQVVKEKKLQAGKFIGEIAKICGGGGGGRPNLAQAGGRDASKLGDALATARQKLDAALG